MQVNVTPGLITSLSTLVVAIEHNPLGGAYLVTLTALLMLALSKPK